CRTTRRWRTAVPWTRHWTTWRRRARARRQRDESGAAGEPVLAPRLVDGDGDGVGEVDAPVARTHRQPQDVIRREARLDLRGKAGRLGAEDEPVPGLETAIAGRAPTQGAEGKAPRRVLAREKRRPALVHAHGG